MTPFHYVQIFGDTATITALKDSLATHISMLDDAYTSKVTLHTQDDLAMLDFTGYAGDLCGEIFKLTKTFPVSCIFTTQYECDDLLEITYLPQDGSMQELFPALSALPIYRNGNGVEQFTDFDIHSELKKRGLSDAELSLVFNGKTEEDLLAEKEAIIEEHHRQDMEDEMRPEPAPSDIDDEIPF